MFAGITSSNDIEKREDAELQKVNKVLPQPMAKQKEELKMSWKVCNAAPRKMCRGSATVCGNVAYFRPAFTGQVLSYNSDTKEWSTLPECSTKHFSLTVVNGLVTTVGGVQSRNCTNTLLSLMEEGRRQEWVEHFPPMPTKRKLNAAICNGKALLVAGGEGERNTKLRKGDVNKYTVLTTVEVMDTDTRQWSTASSLPQPTSDATVTICGDRVYLVGGKNQDGQRTKLVFTCYLNALLQSQSSHSVWNTVTDIAVKCTTCVTLNGQLLAVGGEDAHEKDTNNIYSYNTETSSWDVISHMPTPRRWCLVAVLPGNKLMVVGGETNTNAYTNEVEITTLREENVGKGCSLPLRPSTSLSKTGVVYNLM